MDVWIELEILMKLGISAILGLILGVERELRNKPIGLKTSLVISISSCLLTIVSIESASKYAIAGLHVMDPMRLAAQVVSGVGFLGAGVILRKTNDVIIGLTTAAMIWGASGLGIAVGAGFYIEAIFGALLVLASVELVPFLIKKIGPKTLSLKELRVRLIVKREGDLTGIIKLIMVKNHKLSDIRIRELPPEQQQLDFVLFVEKGHASEIYDEMKALPFIYSVEVETM